MLCAYDRPAWGEEGVDWPNRETSAFVGAGGIKWHVQSAGEGPVLLLIHGTGASAHSWRDMLPVLARSFRVIAPDLPAHGFTSSPGASRLSLDAMARAIPALLAALGAKPALVAGHSAGAAILVRMALDGAIAPKAIVSFNGALSPFRGSEGPLFSMLAKLLFLNPLVPRVFALNALSRGSVERLIRGTGSELDARGIELYRRLMRRSGHVAGALGMMASWDLKPLQAEMTELAPPLVLVVGDRDKAVPPEDAQAIAGRVPDGRVVSMAGLGHLAHEEAPAQAVEILLAVARDVGLGDAEGGCQGA